MPDQNPSTMSIDDFKRHLHHLYQMIGAARDLRRPSLPPGPVGGPPGPAEAASQDRRPDERHTPAEARAAYQAALQAPPVFDAGAVASQRPGDTWGHTLPTQADEIRADRKEQVHAALTNAELLRQIGEVRARLEAPASPPPAAAPWLASPPTRDINSEEYYKDHGPPPLNWWMPNGGPEVVPTPLVRARNQKEMEQNMARPEEPEPKPQIRNPMLAWGPRPPQGADGGYTWDQYKQAAKNLGHQWQKSVFSREASADHRRWLTDRISGMFGGGGQSDAATAEAARLKELRERGYQQQQEE